jgi:hypothetical protein
MINQHSTKDRIDKLIDLLNKKEYKKNWLFFKIYEWRYMNTNFKIKLMI